MKTNLISKIESYILDYVVLLDPAYAFPLALWIVGTFAYDKFDAFPYLVITSATKRSGKTRLSEMVSFACSNPRSMAALTAASMFRTIKKDKPTIIADESEALSSEAASTLRSVLNVGYRRGQSVSRMIAGGDVEEFDTYCPKVFVLIGDVYDTLRDRSIVVTMRRADPPKRFTFAVAQEAGSEIRELCRNAVKTAQDDIAETFANHSGLPFLMDRDEEIWTSLFVLCEIFAPERLRTLERVAVDMATEKTAEARRYYDLEAATREQDDEYARRLLTDLYSLYIGGEKAIGSANAIERLKALPTAPWRKFKGVGLTVHDLGHMLSRFGVQNELVRLGKGKDSVVRRGYKHAAVHAALSRL